MSFTVIGSYCIRNNIRLNRSHIKSLNYCNNFIYENEKVQNQTNQQHTRWYKIMIGGNIVQSIKSVILIYYVFLLIFVI